jgi:hypothetical protein
MEDWRYSDTILEFNKASRPCRFTLGIDWIGGWVGPTADLDSVKKEKISSP